MGRLLGSLKDFSGRRPRRRRHQGCAGEGRRRPGAGRVRDHGPGAAGRRRPDPRPPGRRQGRHPDDRAGADDQQGVPVRHRRHRAGRPADPGRRVRDRRRRRHGVDDPGSALPAEVPRGREVRRREAGRLDGLRRPVGRLHHPGDGRARPRRATPSWASPARTRTRSRRRSHQRAAAAWKNGLFDDEVVPVEIPQRKGDPIVFKDDEGIRADTTAESLGKLRPAFSQGRHDHGRLLLADLRRRGGRRRDEQGQGRGAGADAGWPRSARTVSSPAPTPPCRASRPTAIRKACEKEGIARRRPRPGRDQRGVRQRRHPVDARPRPGPRTTSTSTAAPSRSGHPIGMSGARHRAAPRARAAAARRRRRRGRAVRRRWPGRRAGAARPGAQAAV